jgi:alkylated DNA repair dioxygenase AlkB
MVRQLSLFAAAEGPKGLRYEQDFINRVEERELVAQAMKLPLAPFQFGQYEGKRRVMYFGSKYDFTHQRLEEADPIPSWLTPLVKRVETFARLDHGSVAHALITEYEIGAGIGWHRDKKQFGIVLGVSLDSPCDFRFRRKAGSKWERFTLNVAPRSLYLMEGEARHAWEHSIQPVESPRYSITFRTMTDLGTKNKSAKVPTLDI